ncbi:hydrogenase maturation protease [Rhodococcus sp. OK519]|uniref:hydrogenase maturation protease n=1 Tax=Rhodococcus sp. OK519 TaxID=2135729 RepID=UPI000D3B4708|nr:hydrogenase maturation protease [Rhodococcus sp. OK519]
MRAQSSTVVIGLGNEFRRDDGLGPAVVRALAGQIPATTVTDAIDLLASWAGKRLAIVVDLVVPALCRPGLVHRWTIDDKPGPLDSHAVDVAAALALSRVLGTAPGRVIMYAVEGTDLRPGVGLSPAVRSAVPVTARAIEFEIVGGAAVPDTWQCRNGLEGTLPNDRAQ